MRDTEEVIDALRGRCPGREVRDGARIKVWVMPKSNQTACDHRARARCSDALARHEGWSEHAHAHIHPCVIRERKTDIHS